MMFNETFNNISVFLRGLGLSKRVMVFNNTYDVYRHLSTIFQFVLRGLGLWCLMTLSTIFQFVLEG